MAPRTRQPQNPAEGHVRVSPELEAELRAALAEFERGEGVELTPDEVRRLAEGEWPERLG
jgi:hypothetical protein